MLSIAIPMISSQKDTVTIAFYIG